MITVLYWLVRNAYFIIMSLFLVDGRDYNGENVTVKDAEMVTGEKNGQVYCGITTLLTEHSMNVYFDDPDVFRPGDPVKLNLIVGETTLCLHGIYGAGKDPDETAEKAAEIYMKIAHPPLMNTVTDEQMHLLEDRFGAKARECYLN